MDASRFIGQQGPLAGEPARFSTPALLGLLGSYFTLWLLVTPYAGLSHDAQAYAFQALARLDPAVLAHDVFLRYESQDRYTIFPAIYGALIETFGLETSAAALTFLLHLSWFGSAFLLAQRLFGTPLALLCLGLLIAVPGPYGGQRVFHLAEPFLTARLPAEVVSLLALWAWFSSRRVLALGLAAFAIIVHPLMAFPALLLGAFLWLNELRPGRATIPVVAIVLLIGATIGSAILGGSTAIMDPDWMDTARTRSGFLFPSAWHISDWSHTLVTLLTLAIASLAVPHGPARSLARSAFWLSVTGLALAALAAEVWNLRILMQGQPWRWLWLGRFVAILMLPAIFFAGWRSGAAGRASALLLVAAWIVVLPVTARAPALVLMAPLLAAAALATWATRMRLPDSTQTLLQRGAVAILIIVAIAVVVTASLVGTFVSADSSLPPPVQRLRAILDLTTPAMALALGAWLCWNSRARPYLMIVAAATTLGLLYIAAPSAAARWTSHPYGERNVAAFQDWRAIIPRNAEVFWWDGLREVWFLLQRRSYLTVSQGGGLVFSSRTSAELRRRAENASSFIDPGFWFREPDVLAARPAPLSFAILTQLCRDPALGFVVGRDDLQTGAPRTEWPKTGEFIYLYDCAGFRKDVS